MMDRSLTWANEFSEILTVVGERRDIRDRIFDGLDCPFGAKALEDPNTHEPFRLLVRSVLDRSVDLTKAAVAIETTFPEGPGLVSCKGWGSRLLHNEISRFYCQAVLRWTLNEGLTNVFVPEATRPGSQCAPGFANHAYPARDMLDRLVAGFERGDWQEGPRTPEHGFFCPHVVVPFDGSVVDANEGANALHSPME